MIGGLAFVNPWLLAGLATLPIIWWLLRTTPPRPVTVAFPPTRILKDLINREKTPARSPWWLTLIRMLAAAAVIFALAEPVLNPTRVALSQADRLAIVIDNGWSAAAHWPDRQTAVERLLTGAAAAGRPLMVIPTAGVRRATRTRFQDAGAVRDQVSGLRAEPFAPDRIAALKRLSEGIAQAGDGTTQIVWLGDGFDHGSGEAFAKGLAKIAGASGSVTLLQPNDLDLALAVRRKAGDARRLKAEILSPAIAATRHGRLYGLSRKGQRIAETEFVLAPGESVAPATFDLPLEIRNQIYRLEIAREPSAGAVHLLDARSRWNRVGLISGVNQEKAQPLLSPLYYLARALSPFTDVVRSSEVGTSAAIDELTKRNVSALMLANIGNLVGEVGDKLEKWVKKGGVLIRFAGSRLEQADDDLLPSPLRFGGRTLGGALSWSTPQKLAEPDADGLFAGLMPPRDVTVRRQVLADPAQIRVDTKIWARLTDGTPLVTARKNGDGWLVLFHITANSDWSNLPLSGLFVDMMRRILTLGTGAASGAETAAAGDGTETSATASQPGRVLAPWRILDGQGMLGAPPPTAKPINVAALDKTVPDATHPPGLYGPRDGPRALNVVAKSTELAGLGEMPGIVRAGYQSGNALPLKPWLFLTGLALLLLDGLAVLWLGGLRLFRRGTAPATAAGIALLFVFLMDAASTPSSAQSVEKRPTDDSFALAATLSTRFAYVVTGDSDIDRVSELGLSGLRHILASRTAVEAGPPVAVDITRDELAFFPILYWPVLSDAQPLPDKTLAKIDAYMKTGGLIVFDTRDYGQNIGGGLSAQGETALQRMLGRLDLPRLEPVPNGHVLTKSFYLLSEFPGRWDGGQTWVEAGSGASGESGSRQAQQSDGVSSLIVTSNDLAAAWALDERLQPVFAVVPGGSIQREMAYRTGVNIVMYALTGNYKADQVHVPDLLRRLGQ